LGGNREGGLRTTYGQGINKDGGKRVKRVKNDVTAGRRDRRSARRGGPFKQIIPVSKKESQGQHPSRGGMKNARGKRGKFGKKTNKPYRGNKPNPTKKKPKQY